MRHVFLPLATPEAASTASQIMHVELLLLDLSFGLIVIGTALRLLAVLAQRLCEPSKPQQPSQTGAR